MCQLWGHVHPALEERRHGALPLQCLRALPQDEWHQPALVQTSEEAGKSRSQQRMWSTATGKDEPKRPHLCGDARGVSTPLVPMCPKLSGVDPDFQNKTGYLVLGVLQHLVLSRLVLKRHAGQAVEGQYHSFGLAKATLCFSTPVGILG